MRQVYLANLIRACIRLEWVALCGLLLLAVQASQAQTNPLTQLPRPSFEGTWQIVGIDQRKLKRPITHFRAEHFAYMSYLPIGTQFILEMQGAWGTNEPALMELDFTVLPPIPQEVCPAVPFKDFTKYISYHPLCNMNGLPLENARKFPDSNIELRFVNDLKPLAGLMEYLYELGYQSDDVYFQISGRSTLDDMTFIPYGVDTLLLFSTYEEVIDMNVSDPRQNYGNVLLIAKRVK